jgi:hypothetical protein
MEKNIWPEDEMKLNELNRYLPHEISQKIINKPHFG